MSTLVSAIASPHLQWGAVLGASLVAAAYDWNQRRIPNLLTGPLWLLGLTQAAVLGGAAGFGQALLASLLLSLPYLLLFAFAGGGAGDAKMMAAVGAWLGLAGAGLALASVSFSGVVLAVLWAWSHQGLARVAASLQVMTAGLIGPLFGTPWRASGDMLTAVHDDQKMPYGLAILVGVSVAAGLHYLG